MSDRPPSFDPNEPLGGAAPLGAAAPSGTGGPGSAGSGRASGGAGWKSWVAAGAVAALVGVGAVVVLGGSDSSASDPADATAVDTSGGAQAGGPGALPGQGFGGGTAGTVEAVDGSTLSVRDDSDEVVEVTTSADTQVVAITEGTIDDLAVGDNVLVTGETGEDGIVAAASITDSGDQEATGAGPGGAGLTPPEGMELPEGGQPPEGMSIPEGMEPPEGMELPEGGPGAFTPPTSGAITAVDGSTVTVETADGASVTVTVGADTTITVSSVIDVAEITEGASVVVMGETGSGTVAATSIRVGDPDLMASGFGGRPGGPGGPGGAGAPGGDTTTTTTA